MTRCLPILFMVGMSFLHSLETSYVSTNKNRLTLSYLGFKVARSKDKSEVVVLLKVLASDMSRGDNDFGMWPIDKVNGETFKNFKDFYEKVNAKEYIKIY